MAGSVKTQNKNSRDGHAPAAHARAGHKTNGKAKRFNQTNTQSGTRHRLLQYHSAQAGICEYVRYS
ncbi:MAG: hypothetical protein LBG78_08455 [Azoarcus sp.]|nr:hypothetical protein [Azoarcus sp.]